MKKLAFALLIAAASLAPGTVINVEFKFTPFVGDPAKDEKVTTVPGKAAVFINNVLFAEQEVHKDELPVLFDEHEVVVVHGAARVDDVLHFGVVGLVGNALK